MVLPWQEGGAFWPWYMALCAALTVWALLGGVPRAWHAPALLLAGLAGGRLVIAAFSPALHELAFCALWLCVGVTLGSVRAWVPALCCVLSAWAYVALWPLGWRIEHLGLLPVVADAAFLLGAGSVGLGLWLADGDTAGAGRWSGAGGVAGVTLGLAKRGL